MTRDTLWLPPVSAVYTTHDAAGRPHVCPASLRLATDPEFAERVRVRGEWRREKAGGSGVGAGKCENRSGYR